MEKQIREIIETHLQLPLSDLIKSREVFSLPQPDPTSILLTESPKLLKANPNTTNEHSESLNALIKYLVDNLIRGEQLTKINFSYKGISFEFLKEGLRKELSGNTMFYSAIEKLKLTRNIQLFLRHFLEIQDRADNDQAFLRTWKTASFVGGRVQEEQIQSIQYLVEKCNEVFFSKKFLETLGYALWGMNSGSIKEFFGYSIMGFVVDGEPTNYVSNPISQSIRVIFGTDSYTHVEYKDLNLEEKETIGALLQSDEYAEAACSLLHNITRLIVPAYDKAVEKQLAQSTQVAQITSSIRRQDS